VPAKTKELRMVFESADIHIAGVNERDVDLLFLEEFYAGDDFWKWLVHMVLPDVFAPACFLRAQRSLTTTQGESDLALDFHCERHGHVRLLIENKVAAAFQPEQADRYRWRAESDILQGKCTTARTVLIAPRRYLAASSKGFDAVLPYESVVEWFDNATTLGPRRIYKSRLLRLAIEKAVAGYNPVTDAPVTNFWQSYWAMSQEIAPQLRMPDPGGKPGGAGFIWFRPEGVPYPAIEIVHKLQRGIVDLQLARLGERVPEVASALAGLLQPGMSVARAHRSAVVRLTCLGADPNREFEAQVDAAHAGLVAASRLLEWFHANRGALEQANLLATAPKHP
jgi:hypothetical protein